MFKKDALQLLKNSGKSHSAIERDLSLSWGLSRPGNCNEVAPNHLAQGFKAEAPNQKWLLDIPDVATKEDWLYMPGVLDLFSRKTVGLAMDTQMRTELVERALSSAQVQNPLGTSYQTSI